MIKKLPPIYTNELFYSFLSRAYMQSGIGSASEFNKLVFDRSTDTPRYNFINKLNDDFNDILYKQISPFEIITNHTLFNFYSRFLTKEQKEEAMKKILDGQNGFIYLHMPVAKGEVFLKYCPMCVEEDKKKYGECYFHVEHQFGKIKICPHHCCKLKNTNIKNTGLNPSVFKPLEMCEINKEIEEVEPNSIDVRFTKYLYEFYKYKFSFNTNVEIGSILSNKLDSKYFLSSRCERKDLNLIYDDIVKFYDGYELFDITKRRVASLLRGVEFNTFDILLIAFFEGISINELCDGIRVSGNRTEVFDKKVMKLYEEGHNYTQISKILNVNHETIRKIILGIYNKEKAPIKVPKVLTSI